MGQRGTAELGNERRSDEIYLRRSAFIYGYCFSVNSVSLW
jgi:hypothetical protein